MSIVESIPQNRPDLFVVKRETVGMSNAVSCGFAISERDKFDRLAVVTNEYVRRGYITREAPEVVVNQGVYKDKYEDVSVLFVAKKGEEIVGSLRLIPNHPELKLPLIHEDFIKQGIYLEWENVVKNASFEWSQLAKSRKHVKDRRPVFALIRTAFAYLRSVDAGESVAVIDHGVRELLNGPFMKFNLPQVGEPVDYMGSISIPTLINIDNVIKNSKEGGLTDLAQFLDTGKAPGFEWYQGE